MVRIDFNRLRFLVIDHNAPMRRILRTLLHGFGAREVYEAEDGASVLEAFTHYLPDIIITDWAMPIFDGLERTPPRKDSAIVTTYSDHEVITPENKLRKAIAQGPPPPDEEDPVEHAEKALAELSTEFANWRDSECERLDEARRAVIKEGSNGANKDALFHPAHDPKGEAATCGYPAVASAADSLYRLIEPSPGVTRIPIKLVDQRVDAVRAIYREYARADAKDLAALLTRRLREVTDEFVLHVNCDRPDVPEQIQGPPLAPD